MNNIFSLENIIFISCWVWYYVMLLYYKRMKIELNNCDFITCDNDDDDDDDDGSIKNITTISVSLI